MNLRLNVDPLRPSPRPLKQAAEILDHDGIALYPTDTVYALGCAIDSKKAVERLYTLREMSPGQPLAILCADIRVAAHYAHVNDFAHRILRRIFPGPYTCVLPASREVPKGILDKRRTVGIRISSHPVCAGLLAALGRPILTTSAIAPGGDHVVLDVNDALEVWPKGIDVLLDGEYTPGRPSTVLSLLEDEIRVLREGLGPVDGVLR